MVARTASSGAADAPFHRHEAPSKSPPPACTPGDSPDADAVRIAASLEYMLSHLNRPLSIEALTGVAGTSPAHFFRIFKRATGLTPMNYFIRARMSKARDLIVETALSVKEISAAMGFRDPYHFSRVFKSVHGASPRHYRKMNDKGFLTPLKRLRPSDPRRRSYQAGESRPAQFGKHTNPQNP